jgi:4'-phosphopantetheinyl transferase
MYLYVYEGFRGGPDRQAKTEELVNCAVELFVVEKQLDMKDLSRAILRTEKGKPYFKELPLQFSVSHTDNLWVCLISDCADPVGVDVQKKKEYSYEKIAARYFTDDEKAELSKNGTEAFFEIWTRKEAYAKYTGKGLTKDLEEISTLNDSEVTFKDFEIRAGVHGSCCVKEKRDLCLRMI